MEHWLRRRVATRLAWLGFTQGELADVIGMERTALSRVLRADFPRRTTLARIAHGLGLSLLKLLDAQADAELLSDHPALIDFDPNTDRCIHLRSWYTTTWPKIEAGLDG